MGKRSFSGGFSLIELVLVVLIIGVISAIAVPRFSRGAESAEHSSFANSINGLTTAMDMYKVQTGAFPAQQPAMKMPPDIADQFYGDRANTFDQFGGGTWQYMLKPDGTALICAVFPKPVDEEEMQQVDAILDDGDLSTGLFVKQSAVRYDFCLR